jgi:transcriptional adapter 2-alpha
MYMHMHMHMRAQHTGWHAKRFEFEPEWDNDAEAAIADIEFREGEAPHEEAAKLRLLEIYNRRLDEVCACHSGCHSGAPGVRVMAGAHCLRPRHAVPLKAHLDPCTPHTPSHTPSHMSVTRTITPLRHTA